MENINLWELFTTYGTPAIIPVAWLVILGTVKIVRALRKVKPKDAPSIDDPQLDLYNYILRVLSNDQAKKVSVSAGTLKVETISPPNISISWHCDHSLSATAVHYNDELLNDVFTPAQLKILTQTAMKTYKVISERLEKDKVAASIQERRDKAKRIIENSHHPILKTFREGDLIKADMSPDVYIMVQGRRSRIPDVETFITNKYDRSKIREVPLPTLDLVPLGSPIAPSKKV